MINKKWPYFIQVSRKFGSLYPPYWYHCGFRGEDETNRGKKIIMMWIQCVELLLLTPEEACEPAPSTSVIGDVVTTPAATM